jgi:hypothetical protein
MPSSTAATLASLPVPTDDLRIKSFRPSVRPPR